MIINILTIPTPLGYVFQFLWWIFKYVIMYFIVSYGIDLLMHFMDYGIKANHKYVDQVTLYTDAEDIPPAKSSSISREVSKKVK